MQDSGMLRDVQDSFHIDSRKEANAAMPKAGGLQPPSVCALLCTDVIRIAYMVVLTGECHEWVVLMWRNMLSQMPGHHHF